MKTIDRKSSTKFMLGVLIGITLFVLTRNAWVLVAAIFAVGIVDKLSIKLAH